MDRMIFIFFTWLMLASVTRRVDMARPNPAQDASFNGIGRRCAGGGAGADVSVEVESKAAGGQGRGWPSRSLFSFFGFVVGCDGKISLFLRTLEIDRSTN